MASEARGAKTEEKFAECANDSWAGLGHAIRLGWICAGLEPACQALWPNVIVCYVFFNFSFIILSSGIGALSPNEHTIPI